MVFSELKDTQALQSTEGDLNTLGWGLINPLVALIPLDPDVAECSPVSVLATTAP